MLNLLRSATILAASLLIIASATAAPKPPATGPAQKSPLPTTSPTTASSSQPSTQPLKTLTLDLGNDVSIKLVQIPAGKFLMGSPPTEKDRNPNENQHQVTITKPFFIGVTQITQKQWKAVMGTTPWKGDGFVQISDDDAASHLSWNESVEFCKKLSSMTHAHVRLPTEAEWEYACRAGTTTRFSYGDDPDYSMLKDYTWWSHNSWNVGKAYPQAVAQKKPNDWGLYDMHGNVRQWCIDWLAPYPDHPVTDPIGPATGDMRVLRGGSFVDVDGKMLRSANRNRNTPDRRIIDNGLRIVVWDGTGRY